MSTDERNFRSIYYEKVGFKNVEEKKSLEMLLKEKILDRSKLKQFCLRFPVPHAYRCLLWKLLLGVIPMQVDYHAFVMSQRKQEFDDLQHTLIVTRIVDDKTPKYQVFLSMWLTQTGNLPLDLNLTHERHFPSFVTVVKCLIHFFDDDTDIYWLAKRFHDNMHKIKNDIPKLIEATHSLLEREDQEYFRTLQQNSILTKLPLDKWFECCFAGVLNENYLIKIWDKICGGSYKILAYLASVSLTTLKPKILKLREPGNITQCVRMIPEETVDIIVNNAIDLWQHNGSPLTVHDKPKTT